MPDTNMPDTNMAAAALAPYRVSAYNTAHESENKIHDDATARRFGFGGGLVPGVDVYGYITHMPVARWGPAGLEIIVESHGERCATGRAALPATPAAAPALASFHKVAQRALRPPADETSLAIGIWLGLDPYPITPELAAQHRADLREALPLYAEEGLIHPAMILRACNFVINRNVALGPWIHVSSRIQHLAAAHICASLSARGRVAANYEHKGHRFVDVDVLVLADEAPVAHVAHLAIYQPRQVVGP